MAWILTQNDFNLILASSGLSALIDHGTTTGLSDDDHPQYILHSLATAENDFLIASGSGAFVKKTLAETGAILEADLDHGNIQGLTDDDHTQYVLADGTRGMTADWPFGNYALYIGDSVNAKMTIGLTINQGGADDEILAFKSSDITHPWTSLAEADTWGLFQKTSVSNGGIMMRGFRVTDSPAIAIQAFQEAFDTTRSAAGRAAIELIAYGSTGATVDDVDADANILAIRAYKDSDNSSVWIVDEDGDSWQAGSITAIGLTLNQGGADGEIISLKSSDVDHGITLTTETDTFGTLKKKDASAGGISIIGLADDTICPVTKIYALGGTANTTKGAAGSALVEVYAAEADGLGGTTGVTANGNVFGITCNTGAFSEAVALWDVDGDSWQAGSITAKGIWDNDGDTGVQVEEASDEDLIRMDCGGKEIVKVGTSSYPVIITQNIADTAAYLQVIDLSNDDQLCALLLGESGPTNAFQYGVYHSSHATLAGRGFTYNHDGTAIGHYTHPNGEITKPNQPAFSVYAGGQTNISKDTWVTVTWSSEIFDKNLDFASNQFTAPVDGTYQLNLNLWLTDIPNDITHIWYQIATSNRNYTFYLNPTHSGGSGFTHVHLPVCVLADMDASDVAYARVYQQGGTTGVTDILSNSHFSGFLMG